jgi:hypothetical protein
MASTVANPAVPDSAAAGSTEAIKAPPGWKLKSHEGKTVFCQKVPRAGSNYPLETCVTPAAYEQMQKQVEHTRQDFRKNQTICGTGGCGGT